MASFSFLWHMLILYTVTFLVVLPIVCYHLEYSIYYQFLVDRDEKSLARAKQARIERTSATNEQRVHESLNFLKLLKSKKATEKRTENFEEQKENSKKQLFVAVTVITASRKRAHDSYDPRYLTQVSSQLLKLIELESPPAKDRDQTGKYNGFASVKYKLFFCNVDFRPLQHEEVNSLIEFIPSISRFKGNETFVPPSFSELFEKEKEDYVFCLRESLFLEVANGKLPDYVLLLEDDAYPDTNLLSVLTHVLYSHLENRNQVHFLTKTKENVAYVKLYHPRRLQGFISLEPERLPELLGISLVFGTLLTLLYSHIQPRSYLSAENSRVNLCFLLFVLYSGMVALCIGRQNIMGFRQLSNHLYTFVPAPHCCTPAMLFPRHNARRIINELSQVRCRAGYGKDTALYDIMKHSNMSAYMVSPSLFEHIGMYSMLRRGKLVDPAILP